MICECERDYCCGEYLYCECPADPKNLRTLDQVWLYPQQHADLLAALPKPWKPPWPPEAPKPMNRAQRRAAGHRSKPKPTRISGTTSDYIVGADWPSGSCP